MAQLRDRTTSEVLATGEPRDLIVIADELGADRILWDDVGSIDLDELRRRNAELGDAGLVGDTVAGRQAEREEAVLKLTPRVEDVLTSAQDGDRDTLPHVDVAELAEG